MTRSSCGGTPNPVSRLRETQGHEGNLTYGTFTTTQTLSFSGLPLEGCCTASTVLSTARYRQATSFEPADARYHSHDIAAHHSVSRDPSVLRRKPRLRSASSIFPHSTLINIVSPQYGRVESSLDQTRAYRCDLRSPQIRNMSDIVRLTSSHEQLIREVQLRPSSRQPSR